MLSISTHKHSTYDQVIYRTLDTPHIIIQHMSPNTTNSAKTYNIFNNNAP